MSSPPDALDGAQNAIGGGGRYDKLAEQLGGKPTSGIGFGSGIERLLLTREAEGVEPRNLVDRSLDLFVIDTTFEDVATALSMNFAPPVSRPPGPMTTGR